MPRSALYDEDVFTREPLLGLGLVVARGTRSWGYSCCHSTTKNAYCLGEAGKRAAAAAREQLEANMRSLEEQKKQHQEARGRCWRRERRRRERDRRAASSFIQRQRQSAGASIGAGLFADDSGASALDVGELDEGKLRAALAAEDARKKRERKEREREREEEEEGARGEEGEAEEEEGGARLRVRGLGRTEEERGGRAKRTEPPPQRRGLLRRQPLSFLGPHGGGARGLPPA